MPGPRATPRPDGNPAPPIDPATARLLDELDRLAWLTVLKAPHEQQEAPEQAATEQANAAQPIPPRPQPDDARACTRTVPLRTGTLRFRHLVESAACGALLLAVVFSPMRLMAWTCGALVVGLAFTLLDLACYGED
jgi:hypothetical protein